MDETEKQYRATATNNKKYPKRLTDYITELVKLGRMLEAKHLFLELCNIKPNHSKTIRLGYTIAIATFDDEEVVKYDRLLVSSAIDAREILWFQLRYYHSRNNTLACKTTIDALLEHRLDFDQLSTIIGICLERQSYAIAESLARYLAKNRLTLSSRTNSWLKQIAITKLMNIIQRSK
ncbi:hypothetical protein [Pseudomonas sp. H2_D02]